MTHQEWTARTREAALLRVLDRFAHTAHAADQLLDSHRAPIELAPLIPGCRSQAPADIPAVTDGLDAEHRNLLTAQSAAVAQAPRTTTWQLV
ncbi:hypothetical protein [Streptomyces fuscichromogenes]|uniref:hypothetical protein n=1 Tax=Streptomyces fuscichromogenes TaxID=1324013 RepID=UPI00166F8D9E|nr:hypothetical protein [Streptomyces fuscichromogenes]